MRRINFLIIANFQAHILLQNKKSNDFLCLCVSRVDIAMVSTVPTSSASQNAVLLLIKQRDGARN